MKPVFTSRLLTEKGKTRLLGYIWLNSNTDIWDSFENELKIINYPNMHLPIRSLVQSGLISNTDDLETAFETIFLNILARGSYFIENGEQAFLNAFEAFYQDYKKDNLYKWKSK